MSAIDFPHPETADATGLVFAGGALNAANIIAAYEQGIFPWTDAPVCWFSPDPRAIFARRLIRIPSRLGRYVRKYGLEVSFDTAFREVMSGCREAHAAEGEWISTPFVEAYCELHRQGAAHSVEVWRGDELVGGIFGVQHRGLFTGESMFYRVPNASKIAFAALVRQLDHIGTMLFDCQVINQHTARLGAILVRRRDYLTLLQLALRVTARYDGRIWPASRHVFDPDQPGEP